MTEQLSSDLENRLDKKSEDLRSKEFKQKLDRIEKLLDKHQNKILTPFAKDFLNPADDDGKDDNKKPDKWKLQS